MKTKVIQYIGVALLSLLVQSVYAKQPRVIVEEAANHVLSGLKENKANLKTNPDLVHRLVNKYIIPEVDVRGMSRSVLGRRAWVKASATEKEQFTHEFIQLVIRTYSAALRNYDGEEVKFLPIRPGRNSKKFVMVSSFIMSPNGRVIPLNYNLVKKRAGWKVYDMSVEGVSLLQSFRSQFSQELRRGVSLNQLIVKIQRNKLRKKS
jgi:phospholipid transport system substrate-binding protein